MSIISEEPVEGAQRHAGSGLPPSPYTALGEPELVEAMRRGEVGAIREFLIRFGPLLLERARRAGIPAAEREAYVTEVLSDAATGLVTDGARVPRSLAAYLATALRHRFLNAERARERRERLMGEAASDSHVEGEETIGQSCSEHALRCSRGPDWEAASPLPIALERLAVALDSKLDDTERLIVVWLSHSVPQREIARWLGISYPAAAQRIRRLRARLRQAAVAHAERVEGDERMELERFFRRAGVRQAASGVRARVSSRKAAAHPAGAASDASGLRVVCDEEVNTP
jgi:RNA polymerase sigma factor (sigma-70 family)